MTLIKRIRSERDATDHLSVRRLLDWPAGWVEEPEIRLEEFREDGTLVVRAEMPGIDPDKDVTVEVRDHTLRISAQRRRESTMDDDIGFRSEFSYGAFSRMLRLPGSATEQDVRATYHDGVLEVRVPMVEDQDNVARIPVSRT